MPRENLRLFNSLDETIYSRVKKPVPAKSSKPRATFGRDLFSGLYMNLTLNPLSR